MPTYRTVRDREDLEGVPRQPHRAQARL